MAKVLKVAGIQMYSETKQVERNKVKAIDLVKTAAKVGANMICLPELWVTGYHLEKEDLPLLAEFVNGETITTFRYLAEQLNIVLIVPFLEVEKKNNIITTLSQQLSLIVMAVFVEFIGNPCYGGKKRTFFPLEINSIKYIKLHSPLLAY